jgi:hypothetical protein
MEVFGRSPLIINQRSHKHKVFDAYAQHGCAGVKRYMRPERPSNPGDVHTTIDAITQAGDVARDGAIQVGQCEACRTVIYNVEQSTDLCLSSNMFQMYILYVYIYNLKFDFEI